MALQWTYECAGCDKPVSYSDHHARTDRSLGIPRPHLCPRCAQLETRGMRATPASSAAIVTNSSFNWGPFGCKLAKPVQHAPEEKRTGLDPGAFNSKFGVTPEEIHRLYEEILREDTPVVIAVAPTGSGKSTYIPYRLLMPDGLPLDAMTGGRQIVITQPRRGATIGIAGYVSESLLGADVGIGHEIGYRVRGEHACDWRNRMVYVTDGTLINWIVRGELDRIGMVVIDEAHERSLNIDVIIALLLDTLPQYPHLKVLIVSATIDHEKFRRHFDTALPGHLRCGVVECSGSKPKGLTVHWRNPELGLLPFRRGQIPDFGTEIWKELAEAMVRLIVAMDGPRTDDTPELAKGDVLGFLHGAKPIQDACTHIEATLQELHPKLAENTDVYPLFASVDEDIRTKAIGEKSDATRRRMVIASNAAETSLTIDGLVHVVESGIIKQTIWNPQTEEAPLIPVVHSQAGCRQRWGRVGRTLEGFAWCIYSKKQFETLFPHDTTPEIQRARLDGVVLLSKRGGADKVSSDIFPWLDAPDDEEIKRTIARLQRQNALDKDEDLTLAGAEAAMSGGEDAFFARVIGDADRFGYGIEIATLLALLKGPASDLFPDDRDWDAAKRRMVREAQNRYRSNSRDDLELTLRAYQDWRSLEHLPEGANWTPPALSKSARNSAQDAGLNTNSFLAAARRARSPQALRNAIPKPLRRIREWKQWTEKASAALTQYLEEAWSSFHGIDTAVLRDASDPRAELIRKLGAKKKELEDREIDFPGLDRLRLLIARALPECVFVKDTTSLDSGELRPRYTPLQSLGQVSEQLEIDMKSRCYETAPDTVLVLGPRLPVNNGDKSPSRLVRAAFAIEMDREHHEVTARMNDLELTAYFNEHFPRPAIGDEVDQRLRVHERLRRQFPAGSRVRCKVLSARSDTGSTAVEVTALAAWGTASLAPQNLGTKRRQRLTDENEKAIDFKKRETFHGKRFYVAEDESTEIPDEGYSETPWSRYEKEVRAKWTNNGTVRGQLSWFGSKDLPEAGKEVLAEVIAHTNLRTQPQLLLKSPTTQECFKRFAKSYQVGDTVEAEIVTMDNESGLIVRECQTGFETRLDTREIATFDQRALLKRVPIGSSIRLTILEIDPHEQRVSLTGMGAVDEYLEELSRDEESLHDGTIECVDQDNQRYYLYGLLRKSDLVRGVLVPFKVVLNRNEYEANGESNPPYRVGDTVHLRIRFASGRGSRIRLEAPSEAELLAMTEAGLTLTDGTLSGNGRLPHASRVALHRAASSSGFREAIDDLYFRSNEPNGTRIITDLEQRFQTERMLQGTVTRVTNQAVVVGLENGIIGVISGEELSWWDNRPTPARHKKVGDKCQALVLGVDANRQIVRLTTKRVHGKNWADATNNRFPVGSTVEGVVTSIQDYGAFVELDPGFDGLVHIKEIGNFAKCFVERVADILNEGYVVRVKVISHDATRENVGLALSEIIDRNPTRIGEQPTPTEPDEPEEPVGWNDGPWPWTEGENAIREREERPEPPSSIPPRHKPWNKRSRPASWKLSW